MDKKVEHDLVLRISENGHFRRCLKCGKGFDHFFELDENEKYCKTESK